MHYATLVTVEIEPCEEDMVRVIGARSLIQEIEEQKKENPEHHIMLDIYQSEVKMRSTVFSSRMAEEVDTVMEPFYCETDNPDYLEFEDKTEEYWEAYENETVNLVRFPNGTVLTEHQYAVWHKYEIVDGRLYERDWGPLHHRKRTKRCKRMQVMENVPYYKVYQTFEEFVEERYGTSYYEEQEAYGYYYNPDAFYDWYSIGGRWPDMFLVKEDCGEYGIADRSWTCADKETKAPDGYHWTCAARKKDIAWQTMYDWELEQAKQRYARLAQAFETGTLPEEMHGIITEDGIRIFGELVYHKGATASIVSYPERGEGGSNRYRGNCSPRLVEDLIEFFRPEMICDYMCGSGTTKAAADKMGIKSSLYDLHSGFDLMHNEIPERPEFIFWHPPYWDMVIYSDNMYPAKAVEEQYGYDPRKYDLSRIPDWNQFVKAMNYAMLKQYSALERGGRMAVLMGDIKKKGHLYSMLSEIAKPGTLENIIIKVQHNCFSDSITYSGRFIPILHEYVMIVRKDAGLIVPILVTEKKECDMRDLQEATWRDVVAAVMESCKEAVPLSYLYKQIASHKKAKENQWWREKIRQTLQCNPKQFEHAGRGMWKLKRSAA